MGLVNNRRKEWLRLNRDDAVVNSAVVVDWIWIFKVNKRIHFVEEQMITAGRFDFRAVDELRVEKRVG